MKLNIRGNKVEITDAMKKHIESKLAKLDKYFGNPDDIKASIVVRIKDLQQIVEVTIPTTKYTLRAEETHEDFYAAIDLMVDKLERQIRKNKTRLNDRYRNVEVAEFNFNYELEKDEEEAIEKITKRKNISMKPMDEEEAILQIELLNHDFFVFKNVDEECVSVLYKRKDGNFGIINVK